MAIEGWADRSAAETEVAQAQRRFEQHGSRAGGSTSGG
jgi:hypothetical protein